MASIDELQQQLEIASALNNAVSDGNKLLEQRSRLMSNQSDLAREMQGSLERMTGSSSERLGRLEEQLRRTAEAMSSSAEETSGLTGEIDRLSDQVDKTGQGFKGLSVSGVSLLGAFGGLRAGLLKTINQFSLFGGLVTNVAKGMFNLGFAIVSLPFRLLSGLVRFAGSGGGGLELLQAYEKVREVFGDLASNEGAALIESFQNLRSQAGNLGGTGISLSRVFGVGPGGLATALGALQEVATSLGARFSVLQNDFLEAGGEILALQKGLGLTADQMAALGTRAIVDGQSFNDVLAETASLSIQLGDQFGISSKLISRDIATMASDFENFGSMSQEELATTAVFARKLGIEVSDLQGVIGAFDEFESAAENASRLAQAFGLNVDAIQLLNAENPAERIDMLRESFFAAGKSIESLTRQERALLAQTTGLSGAALEAAFAQENMGLSYDTISQAAEDAAESPMSTEEAMVRLADSIERVFESGGGMDSFFGAFAEGFQQGLRWGGPFRELIMAIRQSLIATRQAGREFARMFVSNFPGLLEIVEALTDAFDPEKFRGFFRDVTAAFQTFFNTLNPNNSSSATARFFDELSDAFTGNFGQGAGSILGRLQSGLQTALNFVGQAIVGAIPMIAGALTQVTQAILALLRGESVPFQSEALGFASGLGEAFAEAFRGLGPALRQAGEQLLPVLVELFKELFDRLFSTIGPYVIAGFAGLFAANVLVSVVAGALRAGIAAVITNFVGAVSGLFGGAAGAAGAAAGPAAATGLGSMLTAISKIPIGTIARAGLALLAISTAVVVGMIPFIAGVAGAILLLRQADISPVEFAVFAATMTAAFTAFAIIVPALGLLGALIASTFGGAAAAVLAGLALVVTVMFSATAAVTEVFRILDQGMRDVDPNRLGAAISAFTDVIQAFAPLTNVIVALAGVRRITGPELQRLIETTNEMLVGVMGAMADTVNGIISSIGVDGLSESQIRTAAAVSQIIGAFGQLIGSIPGPMEVTNREIRQLRRSGIEGDDLVALLDPSQGILTTITTVINGIAGQLPTFVRALSNVDVTGIDEEKLEAIGNVSSAIGTITQDMTRLADISFNEIFGAVANLRMVAAAYGEIGDIVRGSLSDPIEVAAGIERIGDALGVRNGRLEINREALQVTINLNVTMDTDDVRAAITGNRSATIATT